MKILIVPSDPYSTSVNDEYSNLDVLLDTLPLVDAVVVLGGYGEYDTKGERLPLTRPAFEPYDKLLTRLHAIDPNTSIPIYWCFSPFEQAVANEQTASLLFEDPTLREYGKAFRLFTFTAPKRFHFAPVHVLDGIVFSHHGVSDSLAGALLDGAQANPDDEQETLEALQHYAETWNTPSDPENIRQLFGLFETPVNPKTVWNYPRHQVYGAPYDKVSNQRGYKRTYNDFVFPSRTPGYPPFAFTLDTDTMKNKRCQ